MSMSVCAGRWGDKGEQSRPCPVGLHSLAREQGLNTSFQHKAVNTRIEVSISGRGNVEVGHLTSLRLREDVRSGEESRAGVWRADLLSGAEKVAGQSTQREGHSTVTMGAGGHSEPVVS